MKKWISIVVILVILSACIVSEPIYVKSVFSKMIDKVESITSLLDEDKEKVDTERNIEASKELDRYWDGQKKILQLFYNQMILNDFEMKLARLNAAIRANEYPMALTELEQVYRSCFEQIRLVSINLHNIL